MSHREFVPGLVAPRPPEPHDWLFLARGLELVIDPGRPASPIPTCSEAIELAAATHFLGTLRGTACFAAPLKEGAALGGLKLVTARSLFGQVDEDVFNAVGRAISIAEWDRMNRFCGKCGQPTELSANERSFRCPRCRTPFYPRLSPAVIVLIEREDGHALLAHGVNFPQGRYSTLAGFVEPGESLEDAVRREVMEEVRLELSDLRYFGSQPWPFGRSLMMGFNARYAGGEIHCDPSEIGDARWFHYDELPQLPPRLSIARQLVDEWLNRQRPASAGARD